MITLTCQCGTQVTRTNNTGKPRCFTCRQKQNRKRGKSPKKHEQSLKDWIAQSKAHLGYG